MALQSKNMLASAEIEAESLSELVKDMRVVDAETVASKCIYRKIGNSS